MKQPRSLLRENIRTLEPYIPGYQPEDPGKVIKLNANENPYSPSPGVLATLHDHINDALRLYPNSRSINLRRQLAQTYQLEENQVFAANGSDEIISLTFRTFIDSGDLVVSPYPTYTFYQTAANIHAARYISVETDKDFKIHLQEILKHQAKIVFLANPNAQTGRLLPLTEIENFLKDYEGLMVIDEAYIDFSADDSSAFRLIREYDNLLVLRTFSKSFSLCGIRVGYAFGNAGLIAAMDSTKDSYNIAYLNQLAATQALLDYNYMKKNAMKIIKTRYWVQEALVELGFETVPSSANFILACHPKHSAKDIFLGLQEKNILVRYFDQPRLRDYIRISIGTDEQMKSVIHILKHITG